MLTFESTVDWFCSSDELPSETAVECSASGEIVVCSGGAVSSGVDDFSVVFAASVVPVVPWVLTSEATVDRSWYSVELPSVSNVLPVEVLRVRVLVASGVVEAFCVGVGMGNFVVVVLVVDVVGLIGKGHIPLLHLPL